MRDYSIDYESFEKSEAFQQAVGEANQFVPDLDDVEPNPNDMAAFLFSKMKEYQQSADMMGKIFLELTNWE